MAQDYKSYNKTELDGRIKILPEQYNEVKARYKQLKSSRKLAKEYGVDKGTILNIVSERCKERLKRYNKGRWKIYYDKEKRKKDMKKYRDKKRRLGLTFNR